SKSSEHPIILWEPCWANSIRLSLGCRAGAIWARARSTSILKGLKHWEQKSPTNKVPSISAPMNFAEQEFTLMSSAWEQPSILCLLPLKQKGKQLLKMRQKSLKSLMLQPCLQTWEPISRVSEPM